MTQTISIANSADINKTPLLIDLSTYGLLRIHGPEAKKFLQGQLTCDLDTITSTQSSIGAHCNPQGRIVSLFHLFQWQENYYLFLLRDMIPSALNFLKKYAVFFKTIHLSDASNELSYFGLSSSILAPEINAGLVETNNVYGSADFIAIKIFPSFPYVLIVGEIPAMKTYQLHWQSQAQHAVFNTWHYCTIASTIPTLYPPTSGKLLPHDLQLDQLGGVSFNKGCYTGQEIIARMHYRGKLKNRLYQVNLPGNSALPGTDIHDEKKHTIGTLVDSCYLDNHNQLALCIIEASAVEQHKKLFLAHEQHEISVR